VDKLVPGMQSHGKLPPSLQAAQGRGKVSHTCTALIPGLIRSAEPKLAQHGGFLSDLKSPENQPYTFIQRRKS